MPESVDRKYSKAWQYFTDLRNSTAKCHFCGIILSYKGGSLSNLTRHTKRKHSNLYHQQNNDIDGISHKIIDTKPAYSEHSDSEESTTLGPDSELWGFFDKESKKSASCSMCGAIMKRDPDILYKHLKDQHSRISDNIQFKDNEESYTEVIYLEDPVADTDPKKFKYELKTDDAPRAKRPKRRHSHREPLKVSNHQEPVKETDKHGEEIDNFSKYITGLLKGVPKHACTKLQLDIVGLIMTAKLNNTQNTETTTIGGTIEVQTEGDATIAENVTMDEDEGQENEPAELSHGGINDPKPDPGKDPDTTRPMLKKRLPNSSYGTTNLTEKDEKEVENFGNYITCLLQSVSNREIGTKLQMDIVHLIMTARLKNIGNCAPILTISDTTDNTNICLET